MNTNPSNRLLTIGEIDAIFEQWSKLEGKSFEALIIMSAQAQDAKSHAIDRAKWRAETEFLKKELTKLGAELIGYDEEIADLKDEATERDCELTTLEIDKGELERSLKVAEAEIADLKDTQWVRISNDQTLPANQYFISSSEWHLHKAYNEGQLDLIKAGWRKTE